MAMESACVRVWLCLWSLDGFSSSVKYETVGPILNSNNVDHQGQRDQRTDGRDGDNVIFERE